MEDLRAELEQEEDTLNVSSSQQEGNASHEGGHISEAEDDAASSPEPTCEFLMHPVQLDNCKIPEVTMTWLSAVQACLQHACILYPSGLHQVLL